MTPPPQSTTERASRSSSRNSSPSPAPVLCDVKTAFVKYAKQEDLDSGYKCEKCGREGTATKQTRLANIPPILTLHLKRFRYGDRLLAPPAVRRSNRSELSQLATDFGFNGKSGASKVEGHVKFEQVLNLKSVLTDELQNDHSEILCRLFAVVVHSGTTPHSGHYIAFVRNVGKNEWWKMDDSRVTSVTMAEVLKAEAYMLFYRVMNHPVTRQLEERCKGKRKQEEEQLRPATSPPEEEILKTTSSTAATRKRSPVDEDGDGIESRKSRFPPHLTCVVEKITSMIADDMQLTDEFAESLKENTTNLNVSEPTTNGKSPFLANLSNTRI